MGDAEAIPQLREHALVRVEEQSGTEPFAGNRAGAGQGDADMARTTKSRTKTTAATPSPKPTPTAPATRAGTKAATVISLLKTKRGVTIPEMMEATGWQAHSVRGFLAGSLRMRHGLQADSDKIGGAPRRYRLR